MATVCVVPSGLTSVAVTFCAALGPLFTKVAVAVIVLPGVPLKDDLRPAAQMMFVRDLTALQSLQVDYGAPTGHPVFRMPTAEDVAQPRTTLNPFAATLPKPNVVYIRVGPVG